jgi:hypothetical protein
MQGSAHGTERRIDLRRLERWQDREPHQVRSRMHRTRARQITSRALAGRRSVRSRKRRAPGRGRRRSHSMSNFFAVPFDLVANAAGFLLTFFEA